MKSRFLRQMALIAGVIACGGGILTCAAPNDGAASSEPVSIAHVARQEEKRAAVSGTDLHDDASKMTISLLYATKTSVCQSVDFTITISRSSEAQFMLGYYGDDDLYLPLTFSYNLKHSDGTSEETKTIMKEKNQVSLYDGIGVKFNNDSGSTSEYSFKNTLNIFLTDPSDTVDFDSLIAYNIFTPTRNKKPDGTYEPYTPITSTPYYVSTPDVYFEESDNYYFDEYGSMQLESVNTYEGQISFVCSYDFTKSAEKMKARMDPDYYEEGLDDVKNNVCGIRFRFYNFTSSSYRLILNDGTYAEGMVQVANANGASALSLSQTTGKLVFMTATTFGDKDINYRSISNFYLENVTLRLEFYVLSTSKSSSADQTIDTTFGAIDTNQAKKSFGYHNYNLVFWLYFLIVALIYAALAVANYFYRKKKYKNDEFLRVDNRKFVFTSIKFFACTEILAIEGFYIFERFNAFNNSPVVANPMDKWIIIFLVASIIVIGYLIKFGITSYKTHKEMKKMDLLKVNDDTIDDGTVQLSKKKKEIKEAK